MALRFLTCLLAAFASSEAMNREFDTFRSCAREGR